MAYMSQEKKATLAPAIKAILKQYKMKGTIGVKHHSTLVVNVSEGPLDLIGNFNKVCQAAAERKGTIVHMAGTHLQVNEFWAKEHFDGECKDFVVALIAAMKVGNHDRSEPMSDHFDIGWYIDINIGQWNKPYKPYKFVA